MVAPHLHTRTYGPEDSWEEDPAPAELEIPGPFQIVEFMDVSVHLHLIFNFHQHFIVKGES